MPLGQFDERNALWLRAMRDDTNVAGTLGAIAAGLPATGRIDSMMATNTDTIPHSITIYGGNDATHVLFSISVPAGAGTPGTPATSVLDSLPTGLQFLLVDTNYGMEVYWSVDETINTGKRVYLTALGGLF